MTPPILESDFVRRAREWWWMAPVALALVVLRDLYKSFPMAARQGYGVLLLIALVVAVAVVSLVLMPRAVGTLFRHRKLFLPLAYLVVLERLITAIGMLPLLGALLNYSLPLHLPMLAFTLSLHFLLNVTLQVAYAAWVTTAIIEMVDKENGDPFASILPAGRNYWRMLGAEVIGWCVFMVGTSIMLATMPFLSLFALALMGFFAMAWNFASAALLPVALQRSLPFLAAVRAGILLSLVNIRRWWLLLLAQMLLLGLVYFMRSSWHEGNTYHTNTNFNVDSFWTGGYQDDCRLYGRLAASFNFVPQPIVQTLLTLLFGVMAVAIKIAIVQRLHPDEPPVMNAPADAPPAR